MTVRPISRAVSDRLALLGAERAVANGPAQQGRRRVH